MIDDAGIDGMDACNAKAEATTNFSTEAAQSIVLTLLQDGAKTGEVLVWKCKEAGQIPHDDRAFGTVFAQLSKQGRIKKIGYGPRHRGHGTAGAIVWALT